MKNNLVELRRSLNAGASAELLKELPPISSKAAQLLFLPLALHVEYAHSENERLICVDKMEFVEILGLPSSYKEEGNLNKWIAKEARSLLDLSICGEKIIEEILLPRGEIVIEYTEKAMKRFFQNLPQRGRYFTINGTTLANMRNVHTWQMVQNMLLAYNYNDDQVCTFSKNTWELKRIFGFSKDDYMRKAGHFTRSSFEKNVLSPVIDDINAMEQIQLFPVENEKNWGKTHERNYIPGRRALVGNYYLFYKIKKVQNVCSDDDQLDDKTPKPNSFTFSLVDLEDEPEDDIWDDVINWGK